MKESFFKSALCNSKKHCYDCRFNKEYRKGISLSFEIPEVDFECPYGVDITCLEPQLPPVIEQLENATKALGRMAVNKAIGNRVRATKGETKRRMMICEKCENFIMRNHRCSKCGCRLKLKLRLETESCPLGKW